MDQSPPAPPRVRFNYEKAADFREVTAHGVLGSPTPKGKLWMGFFSERAPIPRVLEYVGQHVGPNDEATQIDETQPADFVDAREGVMRTVQFGVYMDIETAVAFQQWLGIKIEEARSYIAIASGTQR